MTVISAYVVGELGQDIFESKESENLSFHT